MKKYFIISLFILLLVFSNIFSQTPDVYWGLSWTMSAAQVDSSLQVVTKEKKTATKTNFSDKRQLSGFSYVINEKGIQKLYVWFNLREGQKFSIHSIDVLYNFDYPYDAKRFKQAYFEKYGRVFESESEPYQLEDGGSVMLRLVKEPPVGQLGQSVFQVSMLSPLPFEVSQEEMDFLF